MSKETTGQACHLLARLPSFLEKYPHIKDSLEIMPESILFRILSHKDLTVEETNLVQHYYMFTCNKCEQVFAICWDAKVYVKNGHYDFLGLEGHLSCNEMAVKEII